VVVYTFRYTTVLYYRRWFLLVISQYSDIRDKYHINNLVNSVLSQCHVSPKNRCSDYLNLSPFDTCEKCSSPFFMSPISVATIKSVAFKLYYHHRFWWQITRRQQYTIWLEPHHSSSYIHDAAEF